MKPYTTHDVPALAIIQVLNPEGRAVKTFPASERTAAEVYAGKRTGQRFNGIDAQRETLIAACFAAHAAGDDAALLAAQGQLLLLEPR